MRLLGIIIVSVTLFCGCGSPNREFDEVIANFQKITTVPTLTDTLEISADQYIFYEYLDTSDVGINLNKKIPTIGINTEYALPPLNDTCYWTSTKCNVLNGFHFIELIKPVLCSFWEQNGLKHLFTKLNIQEINYFLPINIPGCLKEYRDISTYIQEGLDYKVYLWCIHDDQNCFLVIVPYLSQSEEIERTCDDLIIVRAYDE